MESSSGFVEIELILDLQGFDGYNGDGFYV